MGKHKPKKHPHPPPHDPTPEALEFKVHPPGTLRLDEVDLSVKAARHTYDDELERLQKKAQAQAVQVFLEKRKVIFVFEGWDAAGKGGAIKRLTALMDPRGYKVWPIAAPKDAEGRHHYLWRFVMRLPDQGEIAIFDRSWYGRVLVERVEGYAEPKAWGRAYDEINAFEQMLTDDGVALAKFFLHIDKKEQLERFEARAHDPVKSFKIGPDDWRNRKKWDEYEEAVQEMLDRTHRPDAPWHLIAANDKKHARLEVLRKCVRVLKGAE